MRIGFGMGWPSNSKAEIRLRGAGTSRGYASGLMLGGFNERVSGSGAVVNRVQSGEKLISAANGDDTDRPCCSIVVDLDAAIVEITCQRLPETHGVAHHLCQVGFAGEFGYCGIEPRLETKEELQ